MKKQFLQNTLKITAGSILLSTMIQNTALAQLGGDLDTDFGIGGYVLTDHVANTSEIIENTIVLANDKIVMVGYTMDSNQDILVARFNADGTIDNTFGANGKVLIDASTGSNDEGFGVAELSDGKLLVSGITVGVSSWDAIVIRLNTDGSIDNSFGQGGTGKTLFNAGNNTIALSNELHPNADNSFYAGASVINANGDTDFAVFKFTQGGILDASFGSGGVFLYDNNGNNEQLNAMYVNANGNILLAGNTNDGTNKRGLIVRTSPFGTVDSGFNGTGMLEYDAMAGEHYINDAIETSYGKIVAVGSQGSGNDFDGFILQLNTDGSFDANFSGDGKQISDVGSSNGIYLWKVLETNGNILTTGNASGTTMNDIYAYMLTPAGSGVAEFSNGDVYITPSISVNTMDMRCAALQSDGKIIISGDLTSQDFVGNNTIAVRLFNISLAGLSQQELSTIQIYPNPFVVSFNVNSAQTVEKVVLTDLQGRAIQEWKGSSIYTLNEPITTGQYLLQVTTDKGMIIKSVQTK